MQNNQLYIVRKIMEDGFGKANFQLIDECVRDNFIENQFGVNPGKEGLKKTISQLHSSLSNLKYDLQNSIENGDTIWTHYKATAIQSGTFMKMPPSEKQICIDVMDIFRFENGKLKEHWGIPDRFAAMAQLRVFNKK